MRVTEHPSLKSLNTFGVDVSAQLRIDIETEEDVLNLPAFDARKDLVLGGGSNVLLVSNVPGTVLINRILGREVVEQSKDHSLIDVGAGENWHNLVQWTLEHKMYGLENLALIPGNAGAAPVQNIGAYGVELASRLVSVTAWDFHKHRWRMFSLEECHLAYRDSRFKGAERDRFLITSIRLSLDRQFQPSLSYQGLKEKVEERSGKNPTAQDVFDAVVRIRQQKLPDPSVLGNAGSFFKNPILDKQSVAAVQKNHKDLPCWPVNTHQVKISAAWMIESCGFKGYTIGDAGISRQHALVMVNHGKASGAELYELSRKVQNAVNDQFGVQLEPEPKIVDLKP